MESCWSFMFSKPLETSGVVSWSSFVVVEVPIRVNAGVGVVLMLWLWVIVAVGQFH